MVRLFPKIHRLVSAVFSFPQCGPLASFEVTLRHCRLCLRRTEKDGEPHRERRQRRRFDCCSWALSAASRFALSCLWDRTLPVPASMRTSSTPSRPVTRRSKEYTRQPCSSSSFPSATLMDEGDLRLSTAIRSASVWLRVASTERSAVGVPRFGCTLHASDSGFAEA